MLKQWINRIFQDNNGKLIIIGLIALFVVIILMALTKFNIIGSNNKTNSIPSVYNPSKTIIAGSDVSKKEYEEDEKIIDNFVEYCNKKEYEKAYDLLTDECKELIYPNVEKFVESYCNVIFNSKKDYSLQSWINNNNFKTYKILYMEDILSSGNYTNSEKIEDYITIVNIGENKKINTNRYIGRAPINKEIETDELKIVVESEDVYLKKLEYNLKVKNKTKNEIQLDGLRDSSLLIGLEINGSTRVAQKNNMNVINLSISPFYEKNIRVSFLNNYSSGIQGSKLLFYDIILDRNEYNKNPDEYSNVSKIEIKL